ELEPERVAPEGPPAFDVREQIADKVLGPQNLAHRFLLAVWAPGSIRPGLLVPGAIERRHTSAHREELALRIHLAGDAVAQLIEECALETVGEEHAGVSQNERRSLGELARQLPRPVEEPVPGKHLVDGSPFEGLLRRELLPCQEKITSPVASDDCGPDDVLAV